jgi:hypothetical protein
LQLALLIHQKQKLFSSIGSSYDGRIKPDVMQGVSAVLSNQFGNIVTANGTSFHHHGWYGLFWQAFPRKQIKKSER